MPSKENYISCLKFSTKTCRVFLKSIQTSLLRILRQLNCDNAQSSRLKDWKSNVYHTHRRVIFPKRLHFYIDRDAHEYKVKQKVDAAYFFVQNPFIVVNNKQRDSYWTQNEETRDKESMTVDDNGRVIVPDSGFDKPGNSQTQQYVEYIATNCVRHGHISVTFLGNKEAW